MTKDEYKLEVTTTEVDFVREDFSSLRWGSLSLSKNGEVVTSVDLEDLAEALRWIEND
jgi:hypothetical protein